MSHDLQHQIDKALALREPLLRGGATDALRLFNSHADGIDGLVIEKYGPVLIAQFHEGRLRVPETALQPVLESLLPHLDAQAVYRKIFVRDRAAADEHVSAEHTDPRPWIGQPVPEEIPIHENGLTFLIRPYDGFSVGLFLEGRDNRRRVRELAAGRNVLNTFAYTCAFSVAAAAGGAVSVSSVDLSRHYLEWGKRNFGANDRSTDGHWFFASDTFEFYKRAQRQGRRYDLVILDPPTFARMRRPSRTFSIDQQLEPLLVGAVELLNPDGLILFSTNFRQMTAQRIESAIRAAGGSRRVRILDRPPLPPDFAGDPVYTRTVIAQYA